MLLLAAMGPGAVDPIDAAIAHYRGIESYQVTLKSSHGENTDIIRYSYKRPGFVRMDFVQPHRGAVLIYNPVTQVVRLWPFGVNFLSLTLSPENRLVRSSTGQRVDRSDIGALLRNIKTLADNGDRAVIGEERVTGTKTVRLTVKGRRGFEVMNVHRFDLWLDSVTLLPVQVVSRDMTDAIIETVVMDDLRANVPLADELFSP
jgi:outer membrane lipoprotein-sorting protein